VVWFTGLGAKGVDCYKVKNSSLAPDKVLNILTHGLPFCVIIYTSYKLLKYTSYKLLKMVWFFCAAWRDEKAVCLSICLSVKRVDCDKTEERAVQIFYHTKDHLA